LLPSFADEMASTILDIAKRVYPPEKRQTWHAVALLDIVSTLSLGLSFLLVPNVIGNYLIWAGSFISRVPFLGRLMPKAVSKTASSVIAQTDLVSTLFSLCGVLLLSMTLGWIFMLKNSKPANAFLFHCLMAAGYGFSGLHGEGFFHRILLVFSTFNAVGAGLYFLTAGQQITSTLKDATRVLTGSGMAA
jgi:hypothetical protein